MFVCSIIRMFNCLSYKIVIFLNSNDNRVSNQIKNIVILGTGNVASHLGRALKGVGFNIIHVYGRTIKDTKEMAEELSCDYVVEPSEITLDADLYILAITETAIVDVLEQLPKFNKLIVHTAGSVAIDILKDYSENYGVFYPLQTFSKRDKMSYSDIPFCIEANSIKNLELLSEVAETISDDVRLVSSEERKLIHLAAVFACNFPNFLYAISEEILNKKGIGLDILLPLIKRTTEKIYASRPIDVQTGPAKRKDTETINKHLTLLEDSPEYKEIYKLLSEKIMKG